MESIDGILQNKIPIGMWARDATDFVTANFADGFDLFSSALGFIIERMIGLMLLPHPLLFIALLAGFAYLLHRSGRLVALIVLGLLLIYNLGYWEPTIETVALVVCSTLLCLLVGVPLGILAAHREWLYTILRPILDLMQTIPPFVYLIPTLILFGLGVVPGLISTAIFAIAAPIRLTYLGVRGVPTPLLEAGMAFGATRLQTLIKVELPHALPTIMAGITQCIMLSLSMVVIAALVGADGLGKPVVRALNSVNIAMGFEAGLCIVILAVILDRLVRHQDPMSQTPR